MSHDEVSVSIGKAIIEFGSQGVLLYREMSQGYDNALPEIFLGSFMAPKLFSQFQCSVHVERYYTTMAKELYIDLTPDLSKEFGGLRADVVMYQGQLPAAIIELKIYDEQQQPSSIATDLRKVEKLVKLARKGEVRAYVGVMICETSRAPMDIRIAKLESAVGQNFLRGNLEKSADGKWGWCFACTELKS